jgi:DNA invertase Pin-like site-specific DNA recombinase
MIAKGRKNPARGDRHGSVTRPDRVPRGERHGRSKLTETNVREIRTLRAGGRSMRSLAREFGVTRQSIQAIIRRKTWKHV